MKILIIANSPVGLYKFRKELLKLLSEKNCVYVAAPYSEFAEELKQCGFNFINTDINRRGLNPLTDFKLILKYYYIFSKIRPDKVITYTIKPNIYGGIVCNLKNVDLYANITGLGTAFQNNGWLSKLVTILYKFAFKKVKTVFFENEENRKILVEKKIVPPEKTICMNGAGVNLDEYVLEAYPSTEKTEFLFIGRIMKEKGIDELLDAAYRLKKENYEFKLDIIGSYEEDYAVKLSEAEKLGILKYYGFQKDVKKFVKECHCVVLPSYHEGMSNVLLESGAMGRPLITSNIHGCKEAVVDGKSGYLCEIKNSDDLYDKMKTFISIDYSKKKKMGIKSYEHIKSKFSREDVVKKVIEKIFE